MNEISLTTVPGWMLDDDATQHNATQPTRSFLCVISLLSPPLLVFVASSSSSSSSLSSSVPLFSWWWVERGRHPYSSPPLHSCRTEWNHHTTPHHPQQQQQQEHHHHPPHPGLGRVCRGRGRGHPSSHSVGGGYTHDGGKDAARRGRCGAVEYCKRERKASVARGK